MKILKILGSFLAVILLIMFWTSIASALIQIEFFKDLFRIALISIAFLAYGTIHHVMVEVALKTEGDKAFFSPTLVLPTAFAAAFLFYGLGLYKVGCPN